MCPAADRHPDPSPRLPRAAYPHRQALDTRWGDNDMYGHVNNAAYYGYFDTAVNRLLMESGVLDPRGGEMIGLVVETGCQYHAPLSFPARLTIGVGVERLGRSSVRYRLGVFGEGQDAPAAQGFFVHVYVDARTRRPTPLPVPLRALLETLLLAGAEG